MVKKIKRLHKLKSPNEVCCVGQCVSQWIMYDNESNAEGTEDLTPLEHKINKIKKKPKIKK